ncbi:histone-like nucleoid-structuring protein Lsr2 [Streptomyces sp. NPDC127112]|uniref:Lsr2 family DNA-binding protein n=1 Tax=Streptomyces sp. NPDC127112 TaxID=3345364 RepID=UPI0036360FC5
MTNKAYEVRVPNSLMTHLDKEGPVKGEVEALSHPSGKPATGSVSRQALDWLIEQAGELTSAGSVGESKAAAKFAAEYRAVLEEDTSTANTATITAEPAKQNEETPAMADELDDIFKVTRSVSVEFDGVKYTAEVEDMSSLKEISEHMKALKDLEEKLQETRATIEAKLGDAGFKREQSFVTAQAVRRAPRARNTGATPDGIKPSDVREWAAANGVQVNDKGRVPQEITERYMKAKGLV